MGGGAPDAMVGGGTPSSSGSPALLPTSYTPEPSERGPMDEWMKGKKVMGARCR